MYKRFLPQAVKKYSSVKIKSAHGSWITGMDNKRYLDFTSGIGVVGLGHTNKIIGNAISKQLDKYIHAQQMCLYDPKLLKLAELIAAITPKDLNVSFFTPSGSEAVDTSIRLSRYATNKKKILSIKNGFHGRTLSVLNLTNNGIPERDKIEPFVDMILCVDDVIHYIESARGDNIASIIIEPFQGESGIYKLPKEFVQNLSLVCKKYEILLICDEIQCGLNRTGKIFGFEHFGIIPDIILIGKTIANGLPLAAVISSEKLFDKIPVGGLGGTYGANTLSVVAAIESLKMLTTETMSNDILAKGFHIEQKLKEMQEENDIIIDIRVYGLMIGITLKIPSQDIIKACQDKGLLILPSNNPNVIRFLPCLNITIEEIQWALRQFKYALYSITGHNYVNNLLVNGEPFYI